MKVCITSYGPTMDSKVQPVFGRCEYFIFVDTDKNEAVIKPNPFASVAKDAGVESAKLVIAEGVKTVLTGKVGTKAHQVLDTAGIKIIDVKGGAVRERYEAFRKGDFIV
jgi:predicted Fe-Mo cluster-binding NifX family protein